MHENLRRETGSNNAAPIAGANKEGAQTLAKRVKTAVAVMPLNRTLKQWRSEDQPRERLLKKGAAALSDTELLAILIKNGTKGTTAIDVARNLLERYSSLNNLIKRDISELSSIRGLGKVKAITLAAAFELCTRIETEPFLSAGAMKSPQDIARYFIPRYRGSHTEQCFVLLLSSSNRIFREVAISTGTLNASVVHPRDVFRAAITENAASIIMVHNHPSGNAEASAEDIRVTRQLRDSGELLGIRLLDHIIIAGENYISFNEQKLL